MWPIGRLKTRPLSLHTETAGAWGHGPLLGAGEAKIHTCKLWFEPPGQAGAAGGVQREQGVCRSLSDAHVRAAAHHHADRTTPEHNENQTLMAITAATRVSLHEAAAGGNHPGPVRCA